MQRIKFLLKRGLFWGALALSVAACQPFTMSAVVEPNLEASVPGASFDVAVNLEPAAVAQLTDSLQGVAAPVAPAATVIVVPTATPAPPSTPTYPAVQARVGLNVRSGPGLDYPQLGALPAGALARVTGVAANGGWWQIVYPADSQLRAWVSADPALSTAYHTAGMPVALAPTAVAAVMTLRPTEPAPRLLFHSNRYGANDLFILHGDDRLLDVYFTTPAIDESLAAVSPDGQRIAFVSDQDGNKEIYVMNGDGTGRMRLTYNATPDLWPAWSPDGARIAFDSERDGNREIYIMDADGSHLYRVTNHWAADGGPTWSPDGTRFVFHSNRDGNHEIYAMKIDGSEIRRLTDHPADEWAPTWSPDGSRIAFMSYRNGSAEIYVMDVNGGNLRNLTNHPAEDAVPAWSPDGTQIAFESNRDGSRDLYMMNADGGNLRRLTTNGNSDGRPVWLK